MNRTKIEWVKNPDGSQGYTWNPITGCLNGCEYCYARKLANGRLKTRYLANKNWSIFTPMNYQGYPNLDPFYPRFWPERIPEDQVVSFKRIENIKGKGIFVCDMSDLFGIGIPEEWTGQIMRIITFNAWHRFYLLTKRPQNLLKWSPFPDNCWVGVSATNDEQYGNATFHLPDIKAGKLFISFEPLLEEVDIQPPDFDDFLDWVIIGAQTRPYKPPRIEWVKEIVEACDAAGIPVFLKDNLKPLIWNEKERTVIPDWARMYGDYDDLGGYEYRQEMPSAPEKPAIAFEGES